MVYLKKGKTKRTLPAQENKEISKTETEIQQYLNQGIYHGDQTHSGKKKKPPARSGMSSRLEALLMSHSPTNIWEDSYFCALHSQYPKLFIRHCLGV